MKKEIIMEFKKLNIFIGENCDDYFEYLGKLDISKCVFFFSKDFNLTPLKQYELLVDLMMNRFDDSEIYIATHSPYVLSIINNFITANECLNKVNPPNKIIEKYGNVAIDFKEVTAWKIQGGGIETILDEKNKLIDDEKIDEISNELSKDFDVFLNFLY